MQFLIVFFSIIQATRKFVMSESHQLTWIQPIPVNSVQPCDFYAVTAIETTI